MTQHITPAAFDLMVEDFLETQDGTSKDEWYGSLRGKAEGVLRALREHLFREELERATRYEQYLKLRAEFADRYEEGETI